MNQEFINFVYLNWTRMVKQGYMKPDSTFFAVTADEREALRRLGFRVDKKGWCTPPPNK